MPISSLGKGKLENGLVETILVLCPSQIDFKLSATRKVTKGKWRGDIIKKNAIANIQMAFRIRNYESDWQSSKVVWSTAIQLIMCCSHKEMSVADITSPKIMTI